MKWIANRTTGEWLHGGPFDPPYDATTEDCVTLPRHPKPRTERYDPLIDAKIRPATPQEITAFDAARQAHMAQGLAATDPMLLAMGELIRQEINTIRTALPTPLPSRTRAQILDSFKTIYQAVLVQLGR